MKITSNSRTILRLLRNQIKKSGGSIPLWVSESEGPLRFYRAIFSNGMFRVCVRDGDRRIDADFLREVAESLAYPDYRVEATFLPRWLPCLHPQQSLKCQFFGAIAICVGAFGFWLADDYLPGRGLVFHPGICSFSAVLVGVVILFFAQIKIERKLS
jgi:hypothetical protein